MRNEELCKLLNIDDVEQHIFLKLNSGRLRAIVAFDEEFNLIKSKIDVKCENSFDIFESQLEIIEELLKLRKLSRSLPIVKLYTIITYARQHKDIKIENNIESEESLLQISKFILKFYDFQGYEFIKLVSEIKKIEDESFQFFIMSYFVENQNYFYDKLNSLEENNSYQWTEQNFDKKLSLLTSQLKADYDFNLLKAKREFDNFIRVQQNDQEYLKRSLKEVQRDLISANKETERVVEYHNKYFYENTVENAPTFFGDNMPFLFSLFNFFKRKNLLPFGWSYFYTCMKIGNDEIILLNTTRKLNYVGRIFYHLTDYLILHYKDEPLKFLKAKFKINDQLITDNFKTNHMKTKIDLRDDPDLEEIEEFFQKLKKIYYKG